MKKCLAVGIILLFVGTGIIPSIAQNIEKPSLPTSRGDWLYVGGSGPGNYTKIQDAIDDASDGDTVFVYSGIYYEQIKISNASSLTLLGENMWNTIIDGEGNHAAVIICTSGNIFSNFTVQNTSNSWPHDSGIFVSGSTNVITHNRVILNPGCGISCGISDTITENLVYDNGIGIVATVKNNISYNEIYNNNIGINLWECFCDNKYPTKIRWNNISNNSIGINFDVWRNTNNIISDNMISKNNQGIMTSELAGSGIFIVGNKILNNLISDNTENGIYLNAAGCLLNRIEGNQIYSNGGNGILFEKGIDSNVGSLLNRIEGNQIYSNAGNGILFISALWNMIYGNNISLNNASGIFIENSVHTTVYKNTISNNNNSGMYLYRSTHNTIKKNNFFNNSKNAYFDFNRLYRGKPFTLQIRLTLIKTRNKWYGNFWDEPQTSPYKIEGSLGDWYYYPYRGNGGEVIGYYLDRYPAQEPYTIPRMR